MAKRIQKDEIARQLAARMDDTPETAERWIDGLVETLYDNFKAGESITFKGFGSFYLRPGRSQWAFKFTPSQRLRKLLGWSSTYKDS